MASYLVRRLLWMIPTLIGISLVTFLVVQLAPGDPVSLRSRGLEESQSDCTNSTVGSATEKNRCCRESGESR